MAQITFFRYIHRDTVLHRMDGRLKLLSLLLLTFTVGRAFVWQQYLLLLCIIGFALVVSKLPVITIFKELKMVLIMIIVILIMGDIFFASRLILMMMITTVMIGTTSLSTIKHTIEWFLRPIPFVPEVRIATIINLVFVLIPVIFDNYLEMKNAQKARCIKLRKNPFTRVSFVVFPLLSRTLRRADSLVHAMESRCYSEVRTQALLKSCKIDWLIIILCGIVFIVI